MKELQAQAVAAEAARQLESVMGRKPSGPGALKAALAKAESAAGSLVSLGACAASEVLVGLLQVRRGRHEAM